MEIARQRFGASDKAIDMTQPNRRERLRFADFRFTRTPDGRCHVEVALELEGTLVRGVGSGLSSAQVDLRVAAEAALQALETFTERTFGFELIGVKAVRAFDANVIIVSIGTRMGQAPRRLLGVALVEADQARGAVLSVLNATNRVLGNFIVTH
jgi:hypothetical protein